MKKTIFALCMLLPGGALYAQDDLQKEAELDLKQLKEQLAEFQKSDTAIDKTAAFIVKSLTERIRENESIANRFVRGTADVIHWNGKRYILAASPLSAIPNFKDVYKGKTPASNGSEFVLTYVRKSGVDFKDKDFSVDWILSGEGMLYMANISFSLPDKEQYEIMEQFTGEKYDPNSEVWAKEKYQILSYKNNPCGVMPAKFVNRTLFLESEDYNGIALKPYFKIEFKDGKMMSVDIIKPTVKPIETK